MRLEKAASDMEGRRRDKKAPSSIDLPRMPAELRRAFQMEVRTAEHIMLFEPTVKRKSELAGIRERLDQWKGYRETEAIKASFESINKHEALEGYRKGYPVFLRDRAKKLGKDPDRLRRTLALSLRADYVEYVKETHGFDMEEAEDELLELYSKAEGVFVPGKHISLPFISHVLANDIRYQKASRLPDGPEREMLLVSLEQDLKDTAGLAPTSGHGAEVNLIRLMRTWARENKRDHMVSVVHALPVDDAKHGVDISLTVGANAYEFDLKTLKDDSYVREYQDAVRDRSRGKAMLVGGCVVRLEPHLLGDSEKVGAEGLKSRNSIATVIGRELAMREREPMRKKRYAQIRGVFAGKKPKVESPVGFSREAEETVLQDIISIPILRERGFLEGVSTIDGMMAVKTEFLEGLMEMMEREGYEVSKLVAKKKKSRSEVLEKFLSSGVFKDAVERYKQKRRLI